MGEASFALLRGSDEPVRLRARIWSGFLANDPVASFVASPDHFLCTSTRFHKIVENRVLSKQPSSH